MTGPPDSVDPATGFLHLDPEDPEAYIAYMNALLAGVDVPPLAIPRGPAEYTSPRSRPSSAEDVLREHLTHAFTVPVDGPGFETAIDRLVQAVKAAGWTPGGEA